MRSVLKTYHTHNFLLESSNLTKPARSLPHFIVIKSKHSYLLPYIWELWRGKAGKAIKLSPTGEPLLNKKDCKYTNLDQNHAVWKFWIHFPYSSSCSYNNTPASYLCIWQLSLKRQEQLQHSWLLLSVKIYKVYTFKWLSYIECCSGNNTCIYILCEYVLIHWLTIWINGKCIALSEY